jgi:hypothetical protein
MSTVQFSRDKVRKESDIDDQDYDLEYDELDAKIKQPRRDDVYVRMLPLA